MMVESTARAPSTCTTLVWAGKAVADMPTSRMKIVAPFNRLHRQIVEIGDGRGGVV